MIGLHVGNWKDGGKSLAEWQRTLETYAMPLLADKRIDRVTTGDVMAILSPIWNEKRATAKRLRGRISTILKWAVAQGYREDDAAGEHIMAAFPKMQAKKEHQKALAHNEVKQALQTLKASGAYIGVKLAFEFLTLTATRSGEVRKATWNEIDFDTGIWNIPAQHMKAGIQHRVPLSNQAIDVLQQAKEFNDASGLIFPSIRGQIQTDNHLSKLLRDSHIDAVPHGFRSSFRDWCGDNAVPRELAESALAHTNKNQVEAAYARSDLVERRREVMCAWANYILP